MENYPVCPECRKENTYFDGSMFVCPDCAHEWTQEENETQANNVPRDSNGTELVDGDTVIVVKTLDVKGSPLVIKQGTKVKNIRLTDDPELVDCKVEGTNVVLKTCFLKKG